MVKRLAILLVLATAMTLLLFGAASWLFGTADGARWALTRLPGWAGVTVRIGQVEGTLLGDLRLREVVVEQDQTDIALTSLAIHSRLTGIVPLSFEIARLHLDGLAVRLPEGPPSPEAPAFAWPDLPGALGLVRLDVRDLALNDLRWQAGDEAPQQLDRFRGTVSWGNGQLRLAEMTLTTTTLQGRGAVRAGFGTPRLELDLQLDARDPDTGWRQLQLRADLQANASAEPLSGPFSCALQGTRAGELRAAGELQLAANGLQLQQVRLHRPERPGEIVVSGQLDWRRDGPLLSGEIRLSRLDLQGETGQPLQLSGWLRGRGGPDAYQGQFDLRSAGGTLSDVHLVGNVSGDARQATIDVARGRWLDGRFQGRIDARWRDGWHLQAALDGTGFDPRQLDARLNGALNLQLQATLAGGGQTPVQGHFELTLRDSVLHRQALSGTASATLSDRTLRLEQLRLHGEGFEVTASGDPRDRLTFAWRIDRLEQLLAEASGQVSGNGWLRWQAPQLDAAVRADGSRLTYRAWQLETLRLEAGTTTPQQAWQIRIAAEGLDDPAGKRQLERLEASLRGAPDRHHLSLALEHAEGRVDASLDGGWNGRRWDGELATLQLDSHRFGSWRLQQPTSLELSRASLQIASLTLRSDAHGQLEAAADWGQEGLAADLSVTLADGTELRGQVSAPKPVGTGLPARARLELNLANLPMTALQPWLPPELNLAGRLRGHAAGEWRADAISRFSGTLQAASAEIFWQEEDDIARAEISAAELTWQWHQTLEGALTLQLREQGQVEARFALPLAARLPLAIAPSAPISGRVQAELRELGLVSLLFPGRIQESRGRLQVDLKLAGSWKQPALNGSFALADAGAFLPTLGVPLEDITVQGDFSDNRVRLEKLHLTAGGGVLEGSGHLQLDQWRPGAYRLQLQGARVQLVNLPELQIRANPDLTVEGQSTRVKVRGRLELPEVLIKGKRKTGLAANSPDLVVLDRPEPPARTSKLQHDIDIDLILGKQVLLDSAGIDARLEGEVRLQSNDRQDIVATGAFHVAKGRYASYGVNLDITRGSLYFSGGPIDQPTLDILALRTTGEVQAGVKISGTPRAPDVRLYSEPAMAETDILSYIVFGRPVGADRSQAGMLMAAAGALLSQGESVTLQEKLKSRLGLDVLDISSGDGDVSSSIVTTGKYLSPELYVSLGYSLFTNTNEVTIRYNLTPTWEIESNLGIESGVDMYYRLEFD